MGADDTEIGWGSDGLVSEVGELEPDRLVVSKKFRALLREAKGFESYCPVVFEPVLGLVSCTAFFTLQEPDQLVAVAQNHEDEPAVRAEGMMTWQAGQRAVLPGWTREMSRRLPHRWQ